MATARKRWFKTACSLGTDDLTNDQLAAMIRLMAAMKERWASDRLSFEEASRIEIGPTEAMRITGKRRTDVAATSLRCLADVASMSVELRGDIVAIEWPKWAEFQQPASDRRPKRAPSGEGEGEGDIQGVSEAAEAAPDAALDGDSPPKNAEPKKLETQVHRNLAGRFRATLRKIHGPELRLPTDAQLGPWSKAARLMLERDGRTFEQIEELVRWLAHDPGKTARFWRGNVLSLPKLREQFDQIQAHRRRDAGEPGAQRAVSQGREDVSAVHEAERQEAYQRLHDAGEIDAPTKEAFEAYQAARRAMAAG